MRRYARTVTVIGVLVILASLILAVNPISIGGFERGSDDTLLGLSLGLDLQGGSHLEYKAALEDPDTGEPLAPTSEQMEALLKTIERRANASGLGEPIIQLVGEDRLLVQLPGVRDLDRAKTLIGETARLEFKHRVLSVEREIPGVTSDDIVRATVEVLQEVEELPPVSPFPFPFPTTTQGTETTLTTPSAEALGLTGPVGTATEAALQELLGLAPTSTEPGVSAAPGPVPALIIEFTEEAAEKFAEVVDRLRESVEPLSGTDFGYPNLLRIFQVGGTSTPIQIPYLPLAFLPSGQVIPFGETPYIQRFGTSTRFSINLEPTLLSIEQAQARFDGNGKLTLVELLGRVDEEVGLTGEDLDRAYPSQQFATGAPIVNIEFNTEGTRKFGELTSQIAGTPDLLAIILDDTELIAPTVQSAHSGWRRHNTRTRLHLRPGQGHLATIGVRPSAHPDQADQGRER